MNGSRSVIEKVFELNRPGPLGYRPVGRQRGGVAPGPIFLPLDKHPEYVKIQGNLQLIHFKGAKRVRRG